MNSLSKIVKWAVIAAALFIVVMTILSRRPGAGRNDYTVLIDRPPAEVFPWITESYRLTRWVGGLESSTPIGGDSASRGAKSRDVVLSGGKRYTFHTEIVDISRDRQLVTQSVSDPKGFTISALYELTPTATGTHLHYVGTADYASVFARVMEPIITMRAQAKVVADMQHLKELIEAQPGAPGI